jgi:hypothetical protein
VQPKTAIACPPRRAMTRHEDGGRCARSGALQPRLPGHPFFAGATRAPAAAQGRVLLAEIKQTITGQPTYGDRRG